MKKLILFAFFLLFFASQNTMAQVVLGETIEDIEYRLTQDSMLYFRLSERLANADTTLTLKELSTLYYGYALRPDYDPVREERILDAANALARREKYTDAVSLLDHFLDNHPGCLSAQLERAYTAWLLEDSLATVQEYKKYYLLLQVPMASGDGNSSETAFVVSSDRDMELVLDKLGYYITAKSLITKHHQEFYLVTCNTEEDAKLKKVFYFNVHLPMVRGRQRVLRQ